MLRPLRLVVAAELIALSIFEEVITLGVAATTSRGRADIATSFVF